MEKVILFVGLALLGALSLVLMSALFALPVMLLWDYVMPHMFGLRQVDFFHAWGLTLLCGFLVKSNSSSSK